MSIHKIKIFSSENSYKNLYLIKKISNFLTN